MTNAAPTAVAAVIAALSLLVSTGLLGALCVWFRQLVEARIGATHTAQAIAITGEAVRAAEQIGKNHGLDGGQKFLEATQRATMYLTAHGIDIGPEQLRTLIEGAVQSIRQANAAANAGPGVVLTGENATVNTAPPVPSGPTAEQTLAALAAAVGALFPPSVPLDSPPAEVPAAAVLVAAEPVPVPVLVATP